MRKDDFMFECLNYINSDDIYRSEKRHKVKKHKRKPKNLPEVTAAVIVMLALLIGGGIPAAIGIGMMGREERYTRFEDGGDVIESRDKFYLNGKLYDISGAYVESQYISEKISSISNKKLGLKFDIYSIQTISSECLVAVKEEGRAGYYVYSNKNYAPKTLGELIDDFSLEENLVIEEIYLNDSEVDTICEKYDKNEIFNLIFIYNNDSNIIKKELNKKKVSISFKISKIGNMQVSLIISEDGRTKIGILDNDLVFEIHNLDEIIESIRE